MTGRTSRTNKATPFTYRDSTVASRARSPTKASQSESVVSPTSTGFYTESLDSSSHTESLEDETTSTLPKVPALPTEPTVPTEPTLSSGGLRSELPLIPSSVAKPSMLQVKVGSFHGKRDGKENMEEYIEDIE